MRRDKYADKSIAHTMLRQRKVTDENAKPVPEKDDETLKPLCVLIFSNYVVEKTLSWIINLISSPQQDGGAELMVNVTRDMNKGIIVEISASPYRLLEAAEVMEIMKEDKNGSIQEFIFSNLDMFMRPGKDLNNLLSTSEKQRIILEVLKNIRSMDKRDLIGYSNISLYPGQSIIQVLYNNGIIKQLTPLHNVEELQSLKEKWTLWQFASPPLNDIRNYFGESVAFYFAFLSCYTWALFPPAIVGILQTIISFDISSSYMFFAVFKMIWLTLFLEFWKRRSNEFAYMWGTLKLINIPVLHPTFRGKTMEIDPVTKHYVPVYPGHKRHFKVYCISLPIVAICILCAVLIMLAYFYIEEEAIAMFDSGSLIGWVVIQLPGIIYALLVFVLNMAYRHLATVLTEWENHKTQESFDNHRIVKMLLFEFVNNFASLGYIAFYQQDLSYLKYQIAVMMIVNQIVNQIQEAFLPFYIKKISQRFKKPHHSSRIQEVLDQCNMWPYEGTYDDYLELFTQFGYVFLFSSVFPIAATLAILNNVIELWSDGFKLCHVHQRPQPQPAKGIGVWQIAFQVLSLLAVMSNIALITMSPIIRSLVPEWNFSIWLLVAVGFEHIIIAVKLTLSYIISDVPKWVDVAIRKAQYESHNYIKIERKTKTKAMLKSLRVKPAEKDD